MDNEHTPSVGSEATMPLTIAGLKFRIRAPFKDGHVLTAGEAWEANQKIAEIEIEALELARRLVRKPWQSAKKNTLDAWELLETKKGDAIRWHAWKRVDEMKIFLDDLQRIPVIWQHSLHVCNNGRIRAA
jgi:hypothetical protein